jgi:hypothetical protein
MHFEPVDDGFTPVAVNIATPASSSVSTTVPTFHVSLPLTVVAVNAALDARTTANAVNAKPTSTASASTGNGRRRPRGATRQEDTDTYRTPLPGT